MEISVRDTISHIINSAKDVLIIDKIVNDEWYRDRKGTQWGPWYSCEYRVLDMEIWKKMKHAYILLQII